MRLRKALGFTLVEIMIVVTIVALLAAMAIHNLLRARLMANESSAMSALKTVASAEITYRIANSSFATLAQLGSASPAYVDSVLGCATETCAKSGYNFTVPESQVQGTSFVANSIPINQNISGQRRFCVTEDGVVRQDAAITSGTTHDVCQGYESARP